MGDDKQFNNSVATLGNRSAFDGLAAALGSIKFANAIEAAACLVILSLSAWWYTEDVNWMRGGVALGVGLPFAILALAKLASLTTHLIIGAKSIRGATQLDRMMALAELAFGKDFDGDKIIGSVSQGEPPAESAPDTGDARSEARAKFMRHVQEFWDLVNQGIRGVTRDEWLAHKSAKGQDMPAFQFGDGDIMTRQEYDDICDFLAMAGKLKGRRQGATGKVES